MYPPDDGSRNSNGKTGKHGGLSDLCGYVVRRYSDGWSNCGGCGKVCVGEGVCVGVGMCGGGGSVWRRRECGEEGVREECVGEEGKHV